MLGPVMKMVMGPTINDAINDPKNAVSRLVAVLNYRNTDFACAPYDDAEMEPEIKIEVRKNSEDVWETLPDDGDLTGLTFAPLDPSADTLNIQCSLDNARNMKYPVQIVKLGLEYTGDAPGHAQRRNAYIAGPRR